MLSLCGAKTRGSADFESAASASSAHGLPAEPRAGVPDLRRHESHRDGGSRTHIRSTLPFVAAWGDGDAPWNVEMLGRE
jgi:hypothetical protein